MRCLHNAYTEKAPASFRRRDENLGCQKVQRQFFVFPPFSFSLVMTTVVVMTTTVVVMNTVVVIARFLTFVLSICPRITHTAKQIRRHDLKLVVHFPTPGHSFSPRRRDDEGDLVKFITHHPASCRRGYRSRIVDNDGHSFCVRSRASRFTRPHRARQEARTLRCSAVGMY